MSISAARHDTVAGPSAGGDAADAMLGLIEAATRRNPAALALAGRGDRLTYGEMLAIVRRVAYRVAATVPPGGTIAALTSQTPRGLAAVLGCFASGRTCLALNPRDPPDRVAAMLADAAPDCVLHDAPAGRSWPFRSGIRTMSLADEAAAAAPEGWLPSGPWPEGAAAVVHFTSGSTGQPKGIAASRAAVLHRARSAAQSFGLVPGEAVIASSTSAVSSGFSFILAAVLSGARFLTIDLAGEGATALLALAESERADVVVLGTPTARMLLRLPQAPTAFASARFLRVGAAGLPAADLAGWRTRLPPGCAVSHTYASTEATVIAEWIVPPDFAGDGAYVPVGRPSPGQDLTFIDETGAPVAAGDPGELVVTGPNVSVGEWRGGRLVPGRMTPAPGRPGWRVFRTGDVMQLGTDGLLRFSARADRQIKINGVRIEPGEIESVLRGEAGVTDALVLPRQHATGIAIEAFVAAPDIAPARLHAALRERLAKLLPRTMHPARITIVDAFPEVRPGKIDVVALRAIAARNNDGGTA